MGDLFATVKAVLRGRLIIKHPHAGSPFTKSGMIAKLLNLPIGVVRENGLDIFQSQEAWLCRYSNMRYHQEREKRYKP